MSLSKCKCWYSNSCLHFLQNAIPLVLKVKNCKNTNMSLGMQTSCLKISPLQAYHLLANNECQRFVLRFVSKKYENTNDMSLCLQTSCLLTSRLQTCIITTLSIMSLIAEISINNTQYQLSLCSLTSLFIEMLSTIMLSIVKQSVVAPCWMFCLFENKIEPRPRLGLCNFMWT